MVVNKTFNVKSKHNKQPLYITFFSKKEKQHVNSQLIQLQINKYRLIK